MDNALGSFVVFLVVSVGMASMLALIKVRSGASFSEILFRWDPFEHRSVPEAVSRSVQERHYFADRQGRKVSAKPLELAQKDEQALDLIARRQAAYVAHMLIYNSPKRKLDKLSSYDLARTATYNVNVAQTKRVHDALHPLEASADRRSPRHPLAQYN